MRNMSKNQTVILITGASSGIGFETAVLLARRGFLVYGGFRKSAGEAKIREIAEAEDLPLKAVRLDLLDQNSIKEAVEKIARENGGRIDVLVNNAGYGLKGFLEDCSREEIGTQFATNFFGTVEVIKAALPFLRASGNGKIITIGSVAGRIGFPGMSVYSASKFGLEAITDALRIELRPFNIQVTTIQASALKTDFDKNVVLAKNAQNENSPYFAYSQKLVQGSGKRRSDPGLVVEEILRAVKAKKMKRRYLAGRKIRLILLLKFLLPRTWFEWLLRGPMKRA